jgi:Zn-dependent M28 family amino/carboxypeptidase
MLFRSLVAVSALLVAAPALAQEAAPQAGDRADIATAAAAFVKPTNAERTQVVVDQLTAAGFTPEIQTFAGGNDRTGPMEGSNVVVTVGEGDRDIVLTAHYDAVKLRDGSMAQGIVDNAGSVLAMMEAAKALKEGLAGQPVAHRFVFVFTDQEELGLIGAKHFLETYGKDRIAAVINADVAAYGETIMYGENNGDQSGFVLAAVRGLCAERGFDCMPYPVYPPSDDRVFSAAGVPVVSLGTQDAIGAHQMWLAFNGGEDNGLKEGFVPPVFQRIHSADDKLELLNGDDVARFGLFVADLALRLNQATSE